LLYLLEQGPTEQKIIQMCIQSRRPLPEAIRDAPEVPLGLGLFFSGFLDLNDERSIGFSEGPIPRRAMREYCEEHDLQDEVREDFFYYTKMLDQVYLKHQTAKHAKTPAKG